MSIGNSSMIPVLGAGWTRGLSNVLNGELKSWFSTRRWWVQIVIWAASVNLIYFIVALTTPKSRVSMDTTLMLFNIFMGLGWTNRRQHPDADSSSGRKTFRHGSLGAVQASLASCIHCCEVDCQQHRNHRDNDSRTGIDRLYDLNLHVGILPLHFCISWGTGHSLCQYPLLSDYDVDAGHDLRNYRSGHRHIDCIPIRAEHLDVILPRPGALCSMDTCHPCQRSSKPVNCDEPDGWDQSAILHAALCCPYCDHPVCWAGFVDFPEAGVLAANVSP